MQKIRVLIIEDSAVIRELLRATIERDPRLEVAAAVESAEEALRLLGRLSPDVISMDIRLPGMNGFEATQQIMADNPTPIVVVSATVDSDDLKTTMKALSAGAVSVMEKPVAPTHADYERLAERLCTRLAIMSEVKVVRQRGPRLSAAEGRISPAPRPRLSSPSRTGTDYRVLGLVASTGGPKALSEVLVGLGPEFRLPVLLVQHIGVAFLDGFVRWLDDVSPLRAVVARDQERPRRGQVYVAPGERHLELRNGRIRLTEDAPVSGQIPSGTVLFRSMARELGPGALAALLTGMGDDGAQGLVEVRHAGGFTLAEDASTAVVYGMPRAAVRLGGVCESLPLEAIAPRIAALVATRMEAF